MQKLTTTLRVLLATLLVSTLFAFAPTPALAQVTDASVESIDASPGSLYSDLEPFAMIGMTWSGASPTPPALEIFDGERWNLLGELHDEPDLGPDGGSVEAAQESAHTSAQFGTEAQWIEHGSAVRVHTRPGVRDLQLHLVRLTTRTEVALESNDAGANASTSSDAPTIRPRSQWGAAAPTGSMSVAPAIKMAVIHHTAGSNTYTPAQVPGIIKGIQRYHQDVNKWSDIGYNFLVDKYGTIWEGRAGGIGNAVVGAHAAGVNTGAVGVSVLGDYSSAQAPQVVIDAIGAVVGWKMSLSGVNPQGTTTVVGNDSNRFANGATVTLPTVVGHRDVGYTSCPGQIQSQLASIRSIAAQWSPVSRGTLDQVVEVDRETVMVRGWGYDRTSSERASVVVARNGTEVLRTPMHQARYDVKSVYSDAPITTGFQQNVPLREGDNNICVYVAENTYGAGTLLGCKMIAARNNPVGTVDSVALKDGTITVNGWAFDPNTSDPIPLHIYVNGRRTIASTGLSRPDVAKAKSGAPGNTGYSVSLPVHGSAPYEVCTHAINVGPGSANILLGCREVGRNHNPVGEFLIAVNHQGNGLIGGWALDPDSTGPTLIMFFNNGQPAFAAFAALPWDGLTGKYPKHGINRMFFSFMPIQRGRNEICAFAINVGPGDPATSLGCKVITR